jgi:hypothetical protein
METKKMIGILLLFITCNSCMNEQKKSPKIENVEKENKKPDGRQITLKYYPEEMRIKLQPEEKINIKENYTVTLINSDVIDRDMKNLKEKSDDILKIYYDLLMKNNKTLNYNQIIVEIIHKNKKKHIFQYNKKNVAELIE